MNLFGSVGNELSQNQPHANFMSFPASMLTLFRLSTGDSWDEILQVSGGLGFKHYTVVLPFASQFSGSFEILSQKAGVMMTLRLSVPQMGAVR